MKNYTYGWRLKELGYVEVPAEQYTDRQREMQGYIEVLSEAVRKAQCGWDGVRYAVMQYTDKSFEKYMVLWSEDINNGRWIPITGNSKGCCLSVLGENLW
jgi:hypothetical protein